MIKKKNKWKKGVGLRETTPRDEDILDEGDFVMDGYSVQIPRGGNQWYGIRQRRTYCSRQISQTH